MFNQLRYLILLLSFGIACNAIAFPQQQCTTSVPNEWPDNRYINHGNGTVTDRKTDLMWKQCTEGLSGVNCEIGQGSYHSWVEALQAAQALNSSGFAQYTDWRLPNITELKSLVRYNCRYPTINETAFPNTPFDDDFERYFISSTPFTNEGTSWDPENSQFLMVEFTHAFYTREGSRDRPMVGLVRLVRSEDYQE